MANTVARVAYVGNHGSNQQHEVDYNDATPAYIWYATKKTRAADRRIRQRGHAAVRPARSMGPSICSAPIGYVQSQQLPVRAGAALPQGLRLPGLLPAGEDAADQPGHGRHAERRDRSTPRTSTCRAPCRRTMHDRNRFLNYRLDPNTPKHQIQWNFIADVPLGAARSSDRT